MNERKILAQSRTVLVEQMFLQDGLEVVRKTYSFPTTKDRFRGLFRGTLLGWNKAHREYQNLSFLEQAGIPVVKPIAWDCKRNALGLVTACTLTTQAFPGQDLAQSLQGGAEISQECWQRIGQSLCKMHRAGFWHRGCSARNLMIEASERQIAWLDTTKSKLYSSGSMPHEKRASDLLRFWTPLGPHTTEAAKRAFAAGYGEEVNLSEWWSWIPKGKRAPLRRELQREEARFAEH